MPELVGGTVMLVPSPTSPPSPVISGGQFAPSVNGNTLAAPIPVLARAHGVQRADGDPAYVVDVYGDGRLLSRLVLDLGSALGPR